MNITNLYRSFTTLSYSSEPIKLQGWVTSIRSGKKLVFFSINDGSYFLETQVVCFKNDDDMDLFHQAEKLTLHSSIEITGKVVPTPKRQQPFEIKLQTLRILQLNDLGDYPLQKKEQTLAFLRNYDHLRVRTKVYQAIMKIRSKAFYWTHRYFQENHFIYVTTPILTRNDCEGAGEVFYVNSSLNENAKKNKFFDNSSVTLTVSGQLHVEAYAQTYRKVYAFGPTFRADKSKTSKHLSEFWMLEPEVAFCDITGNMDLIEDFVKFFIQAMQNECPHEITFLSERNQINLQERFDNVINSAFPRITYRAALKILQKAHNDGVVFEEHNFIFGIDLQKEHELYLAGQHFKGPVFIYNYPTSIKAFYMKQNADETVAACDLIISNIGELVGGSQRESDINKLQKLAAKKNVKLDELTWYLDLRKFGFAYSSGFGLGFERLIMFITGMNNIRDVISYPRTVSHIKY